MGRILAHNFAGATQDEGGSPLILHRGDEVPDWAIEQLEEKGALVPEGLSLSEHLEINLDAYRAPRGDSIAAQKLAEAAALGRAADGIADLGPGASGTLAERIGMGLTVDQTIALAEDDPEKAKQVLEAEREASGGEPRKGVEDGLSKIIG